MNKGAMSVLALILLGLMGLVMLSPTLSDSITDAATQTFAVTTSTGSEDATLTLTAAHWYSDTESMTVQAATDGNLLPVTVVGADRRTLTVTVPTGTTQNIIVTSISAITDDDITLIVLKVLPFLLLISIIGASFTSGARASGFVGGTASGMSMESMLQILIMVILIPVVLSFVSLARAEYANAPEFIGVGVAIGLTTIAYIFSVLGNAFGAVRGSFGQR